MCDFCNNILPLDVYRDQFHYDWEEKDGLVYLDGKRIALFVPCTDDPYYDKCIKGIKYCPMCGREL